MIGSAPRTRPTPWSAVDEAFLDLVCSDEEWLRAEFDAMVAAEWGSVQRPPPRPDSPTPPPRPPGCSTVEARPIRPAGRERALVRRVARQRGPPGSAESEIRAM